MNIVACYSSRTDYALLSPMISGLEKCGAEIKKINIGPWFLEEDPFSFSVFLTRVMEKLAGEFAANRPNVVLLLGDRHETIGVALIASVFRIPVVHVRGDGKETGLVGPGMFECPEDKTSIEGMVQFALDNYMTAA